MIIRIVMIIGLPTTGSAASMAYVSFWEGFVTYLWDTLQSIAFNAFMWVLGLDSASTRTDYSRDLVDRTCPAVQFKDHEPYFSGANYSSFQPMYASMAADSSPGAGPITASHPKEDQRTK